MMMILPKRRWFDTCETAVASKCLFVVDRDSAGGHWVLHQAFNTPVLS